MSPARAFEALNAFLGAAAARGPTLTSAPPPAAGEPGRHREPRSGVAIQGNVRRPSIPWIAASPFGLLAMTDRGA